MIQKLMTRELTKLIDNPNNMRGRRGLGKAPAEQTCSNIIFYLDKIDLLFHISFF